MKYALIILLFPFCLFGQRETKLDSTWIESSGGKFFGVRRVVYQNDEETYTRTLIGDTARLVQNQVERIVQQAASMARDAQTVSVFKRNLAGLVRESNSVKTASGVSPMDTVQKLFVSKFLATGWTIREAGVLSDIVFTVNAQGALRYRINAGTARGADLFGDVLILNAYPTAGNQVELYKNSEGNYMNFDRSVVVREPGSGANLAGSTSRTAITPPEIAPQPAQKAPEAPVNKPKKAKKKVFKN